MMKVAEVNYGKKMTNAVLNRCKNSRHSDKRKKLDIKYPKKAMAYFC